MNQSRYFVKTPDTPEQFALMQNHRAFVMLQYLKLRAERTGRFWQIGNQSVYVKSGQVIVGRVSLAAALKMSEKNVRTTLDALERVSEIRRKPANRFTLVTILKWSEYYGQAGQQRANSGPTVGHVTENEEGRELEEAPFTTTEDLIEGATALDHGHRSDPESIDQDALPF